MSKICRWLVFDRRLTVRLILPKEEAYVSFRFGTETTFPYFISFGGGNESMYIYIYIFIFFKCILYHVITSACNWRNPFFFCAIFHFYFFSVKRFLLYVCVCMYVDLIGRNLFLVRCGQSNQISGSEITPGLFLPLELRHLQAKGVYFVCWAIFREPLRECSK